MEIPDGIMGRYTAQPGRKAPRSEWEEAVDAFYERINTPFGVKKFGEMSRGHIGKGLQGKSKLEIWQLFKKCKDARSFGAMFRHLTGV